jgi:hypothetical protein
VTLARRLLPLLGGLLPLGGSLTAEARRGLGLQLGLGAMVLVLASTAFGFGVAACYMALATSLSSPPLAAALVAAGLALIAVILVCAMTLVARDRALRRAQARIAARQAAMAPLDQLVGQVAAKPLQSLLVAAVAGVIAGWIDRRL